MQKTIIFSLLFYINIANAFNGLGNIAQPQNQTLSVHALSSASSNNLNYQIISFSDSNILVKEYIDDNNFVFAVTWSGDILPDLSSLLGTYAQSTPATSTIRHPKNTQIQNNNLIIGKHYQGRLKKGFAYLNDSLPSNFDVNILSQ